MLAPAARRLALLRSMKGAGVAPNIFVFNAAIAACSDAAKARRASPAAQKGAAREAPAAADAAAPQRPRLRQWLRWLKIPRVACR